MGDAFWLQNIAVIWNTERLVEFFPSHDQSLEERLNAFVRLMLYISILLSLHHGQPKYLSVAAMALAFTYFIYQNRTQDPSTLQQPTPADVATPVIEGLDEKACTVPSLDNPFMNVTMKDYLNIDGKSGKVVEKLPACDINDPQIKKQIDEYFNNSLYRDVSDVFGKMNSQRQFYTMPSTTIPNKQDEFARWLYASPKTCKEDQDFCLRYEDVRAKAPVFPDAEANPTSSKAQEGQRAL